MSEISYAHRSMCLTCGRWVNHKPYGGPHRFHWCRLRFISGWRRRIHSAAWDDGYRFALDNISDPMVYADLNEYGTGWAGAIAQGGIVINLGEDATDE